MSDLLEGATLTQPVVDALRHASADSQADSFITTRDLMAQLIRVDHVGRWDRVFLHATHPDTVTSIYDLENTLDPHSVWSHVRISAHCANALRVARHISDRYDLWPMPAGVLALGLISDPESTACHIMLSCTDLSHQELIDLIQDEVLGVSLGGVTSTFGLGQPEEHFSADVAHASNGILTTAQRYAPPGESAGAVELLTAVLDFLGGGQLEYAIDSLPLDARFVATTLLAVQDFETVPAESIIAAAADQFTTARPTADQLLVTLTRKPVNAVRKSLWYAGLDSDEVAVVAANIGYENRKRPTWRPDYIMLLSTLHLLIAVVVAALVILHVAETRDWPNLLLLLISWWGYPGASPWIGAPVSVSLLFLVGPLAAGACATGLAIGLASQRAERFEFFRSTGVQPSLKSWRRCRPRLLKAAYCGHIHSRVNLLRTLRGSRLDQNSDSNHSVWRAKL